MYVNLVRRDMPLPAEACRYLLTPVEKEGLGRSQLVIAADQNKTSVMGPLLHTMGGQG